MIESRSRGVLDSPVKPGDGSLYAATSWIASRSLSSSAQSRDLFARNDGKAARLKLTLHRSVPSLGRNDLAALLRILLQETLEVRLHGIRQRDRISHVVDRAIEAEAHHAGEVGLAVRFGQQQRALAGTFAGVERAERVAGCVEHPERPAQTGD